jgi:hypothetical protein
MILSVWIPAVRRHAGYLSAVGLTVHHHICHARRADELRDLASHDWVLCMDSDEILDDGGGGILALKAGDEPDPAHGVCRYWLCWVKVRTIYPVSSPDFPVRLFNRPARFNDRPVMIRWSVLPLDSCRDSCATIPFIRCMKCLVSSTATPPGW